jgi:hypothetical protein
MLKAAVVNTANSATGPMMKRRIDPALDGADSSGFFDWLIVFYLRPSSHGRP